MPHLRIETNVPKSQIPQDFVLRAVPVLAKALGKPEQYCVVSVIPDVLMSFGGNRDPCAIANLMSIGGLGVEQNKKHSKVVFDLVKKELGISNDKSSDLRGWFISMIHQHGTRAKPGRVASSRRIFGISERKEQRDIKMKSLLKQNEDLKEQNFNLGSEIRKLKKDILKPHCAPRHCVPPRPKVTASRAGSTDVYYAPIKKTRMYITFEDNNTGNVGYKGTTFHAIFG